MDEESIVVVWFKLRRKMNASSKFSLQDLCSDTTHPLWIYLELGCLKISEAPGWPHQADVSFRLQALLSISTYGKKDLRPESDKGLLVVIFRELGFLDGLVTTSEFLANLDHRI